MYDLVALAASVETLYALAAQGLGVARLCARGDLDLLDSLKSHDVDVIAECGLCKCEGNLAVNIVAVTLEEVMRTYIDIDVEITVRTAIDTSVALAAYRQCLTVVNAGREVHHLLSGDAYLSCAGALGTLLLDYASGSAALTAGLLGLDNAEHGVLLGFYVTGTAAVVAGLGGGAGFCSGTRTVAALLYAAVGNFLFAAHSGFLKGKHDGLTNIAAAAGGVGCVGSGGSAGEAAAEEAAENIAEVAEITEIKAAEATAAASAEVGVDACVTELIVTGALLLVGENLVGFVYLLEFSLRTGIIGVKVGVIFFGRLTIRFFYFIIRSRFFYTQNGIIIAFVVCHNITSFTLGLYISNHILQC